MYSVIGKTFTRTFRVLWALEEMGVAYTHVPVGPATDEARAENPTGKVPALRDGDALLTDSVAILSYLSDRHGALGFAAGTHDRARQDALLHRINEELDAALWMAVRHQRLLPEDKRVPAVVDTLMWEFDRAIARFDAELQGPFLQGDQMTVADILMVHCLNWATGAKFPVQGEKIRAYAREMRARPAFKRVMDLG
ncbi:MAG: glutathione S-transferase family protein [Rhodobacteraceae bacterium]|nr:glutathione S-transferase family protein [Paracoccaceae bacterium]